MTVTVLQFQDDSVIVASECSKFWYFLYVIGVCAWFRSAQLYLCLSCVGLSVVMVITLGLSDV